MIRIIFSISFLVTVGCATPETVSTPVPSVTEGADSVEAPPVNEPSRVLNKNKKCPKNSKMVNGKCTLQVESND